MARKKSNRDEIVDRIYGCDERGEYTIYVFGDGSEYTARDFIKDTSIPENPDGKTYMERIAPQMIPFEKWLADRGETKQEWWRRHEEAVQSRIHGCEMKTIIVP